MEESTAKQVSCGSLVWALWPEDGQWYTGRVCLLPKTSNGSYGVIFDGFDDDVSLCKEIEPLCRSAHKPQKMQPMDGSNNDNKQVSRWDLAVARAASVTWIPPPAPVPAQTLAPMEVVARRLEKIVGTFACELAPAQLGQPAVSIALPSGVVILAGLAIGPNDILWSLPKRICDETGESIALLCPSGETLKADEGDVGDNPVDIDRYGLLDKDVLTVVLSRGTEKGQRNQMNVDTNEAVDSVSTENGIRQRLALLPESKRYLMLACKEPLGRLRLWADDASCQLLLRVPTGKSCGPNDWKLFPKGYTHTYDMFLLDGQFKVDKSGVKFDWLSCVSCHRSELWSDNFTPPRHMLKKMIAKLEKDSPLRTAPKSKRLRWLRWKYSSWLRSDVRGVSNQWASIKFRTSQNRQNIEDCSDGNMEKPEDFEVTKVTQAMRLYKFSHWHASGF